MRAIEFIFESDEEHLILNMIEDGLKSLNEFDQAAYDNILAQLHSLYDKNKDYVIMINDLLLTKLPFCIIKYQFATLLTLTH